MNHEGESAILELVDAAEDLGRAELDVHQGDKPRLLIENSDPDRTVAALRDILADAGGLYDRGVPVRLARDQIHGGVVAQVMTPEILTMYAHAVCRPFLRKEKPDGSIEERHARLPRSLAVMYLEWRGEWNLSPLNGIASAPLLIDDGTILSAEGYDSASGMWRESVPDLSRLVPERPTRDEAESALDYVRDFFRTFCFADADMVPDPATGGMVVETDLLPGRDESAFLCALMTAVCRPSLHLAPGVVIRAAPMSGAGAGKGLLARCIAIIAYGKEPQAVTCGATPEELEKRIAAELIEGGPVLFLDNLNNRAFKSDLLASAITERPARVRVLGRSQMVPLNASAFVVMTGNGLTVSEDLARRFIAIDLDPRTEDPEARRFQYDIKREVKNSRSKLLAAILTIWRWGRQRTDLPAGRPLGSFEQWCRWVRDPLIALGCRDPAERVSEAKERDGKRQVIAELFAHWWDRHSDRPMAASNLAPEITRLIDPQQRGRQFVSSALGQLAGTRLAGFVLTRQAATGRWGAATYALESTGDREGHRKHREHREHREHRSEDEPGILNRDPYAEGECGGTADPLGNGVGPMRPLTPMPSAREDQNHALPAARWKARL